MEGIVILGIIVLIIFIALIEWIIGKAIGNAVSKGTGLVLGIVLILCGISLIIGIAIIIYSGKNKEELSVNVNLNTNDQYSSIGDTNYGRPLFSSQYSSIGDSYYSKSSRGQIQENKICQRCGKSNSGGYTSCPYCGSNTLVSPSAYISSPVLTRNVTPENSIQKPDLTDKSVVENEIRVQFINADEVEKNDNKTISDNDVNYFIGKNWKDILMDNNLVEYIVIFENNKLLDFKIVSELNETDLEKLGITIMGDRKMILKLINGINIFLKKR